MCSEGIIDKYVNFYTDFAFKKLFGTEINKDLLISFLNALFEGKEVIKEVTYLHVDCHDMQKYDRRTMFAVFCKNDKGEMFIIEMQKGEQQFFKDRSIFYSTFAIREQVPHGYRNYELKGVYTIGIMNFCIFEDEDVRHDVTLVDMKTKQLFFDKLTFVFLEMPKFLKKESELEDMFDKWLYAIRNLDSLMKRPASLQEKVFKRLFEVAEIAQFDRKERVEYEDSLKVMRNWYSVMETAKLKGEEAGKAIGFEKGMAEGMEKGMTEGDLQARKETALRLKEMGLPMGDIAATRLSEDEIGRL